MSVIKHETGNSKISFRTLHDLNKNRAQKLQFLFLLPRKLRTVYLELKSKDECVSHLHTILDHLKQHLTTLAPKDIIELLKHPCEKEVHREWNEEQNRLINTDVFKLYPVGFIKRLNRKTSLSLPTSIMIVKVDLTKSRSFLQEEITLIQTAFNESPVDNIAICSRDPYDAECVFDVLPTSLQNKSTIIPLDLIFAV